MELKKITIQTSVLSKSFYTPEHARMDLSAGTMDSMKAELLRRTIAMETAHNLVSEMTATGDIDGSIENALKGIHYHQDTKRGQTNVYLYGITIYIHYKG